MTVDQIHLYAETFAAMAVITSVIYLAIQIRQGSKSSQAAAIATLLAQWDSPNALIAGSKECARVLRLGTAGGEGLDPDEVIQFQCMLLEYFAVYHTAFHFHRDGILSNEQWYVYRRVLVEFSDYPGISAQMPYFKSYYSPDPEFVRELERIANDHIDGKDPTFRGAFEKNV